MPRIIDNTGSRTDVILDPFDDELSRLETESMSIDWEAEVATQLMGRVGLRAHEAARATPAGLRWSDAGDVWFLAVDGKDTTGTTDAGKRRSAVLPDDVATNIQRFVAERERSRENPIISVSTRTVRRWITRSSDNLDAQTPGENWDKLSSHDLRRSWATYHLVERGVSVRTMMAIGGWSDYSAIEPYLATPTESRIGDTFRDGGDGS